MTTPRFELPKVRNLFIPDPGYVFVEADLAGADARVAAWECGGNFRDDFLGTETRPPIKIHANSLEYLLPDYYKLDPRYEPWYTRMKNCAFGTLYAGGPKTISAESGCPLHLVQAFQPWFLGKYPTIKQWHNRLYDNLLRTKQVWNRFGYRFHFFDRIEGCLPDATAWLCSSTVAIACFRGCLQVRRKRISGQLKHIRLAVPVHDSGSFLFPIECWPDYILELRETLRVTVPYDEPLEMPWTIKASVASWGECKELDFDNLPSREELQREAGTLTRETTRCQPTLSASRKTETLRGS